ncbi:5-formyltetrahydrofolate cyclo-ligase [Paenibacillus sp. L3-i20]|uniref:5-formyltetrahydrofolate cyclo-ligase n=1 Tax=Paenibacillus sp. L3-i20 TaxID=2905833 RepID=UPI001EDECBD2|nr:5-formyltetrahydrofolate cyclo-ligase [Paenibacillus sp. L3-i20]GKU76226.1 5-formyltetrahydrofolate cyclo-ligase [Paenibacillus sp. L3-i20]
MATGNGITNKAAFRTRLSMLRNAIDVDTRSKWSSSACRHLANLVEERSIKSILVYVSFRSELDLRDFVTWCWQNGLDVIVPKCIEADHSMTLHRLRDWNELKKDSFGILEPDPDLSPALQQSFMLDMIVVPGLAFDLQGGRMGYGGGYYDRLAESLLESSNYRDKKLLWIGASFEAQLVEHVPSEVHDLRLDGVITEKSTYMYIN